MPVTVNWDANSHTTIVFTCTGRWTFPELEAARERFYELSKDLPFNPSLIVDNYEGTFPSDGFLTGMGKVVKRPRREYDLAVVVTRHLFIEQMVRVVSKIYGNAARKYVVVHSMDEARDVTRKFESEPGRIAETRTVRGGQAISQ